MHLAEENAFPFFMIKYVLPIFSHHKSGELKGTVVDFLPMVLQWAEHCKTAGSTQLNTLEESLVILRLLVSHCSVVEGVCVRERVICVCASYLLAGTCSGTGFAEGLGCCWLGAVGH